jgi:hypothetical protein
VCKNRYEKKITDFNFGSLIRTDSTKEYNESNTIFGALVVPAPAVVGYSGRLSLTDKCAYLPGIIVTRIQVRDVVQCGPGILPDVPDASYEPQ